MSPQYCPNCGSEVNTTNQYCSNCGQQLAGSTQGTQQPAPGQSQNPRAQQRPPQQPRRNNPQRQQQARQNPPRSQPQQRAGQQQTSRRGLLLGGGILAALGIGGGAYFFLWNQEGPADVAKEFINAIDDGNLSDANDLIHTQATVDGAGVASQILLGQIGGGVALEAIDISVNNSETVEKNDGRALVRLNLNIDAGFGETDGNIEMAMRKENGDWRVWNLGV